MGGTSVHTLYTRRALCWVEWLDTGDPSNSLREGEHAPRLHLPRDAALCHSLFCLLHTHDMRIGLAGKRVVCFARLHWMVMISIFFDLCFDTYPILCIEGISLASLRVFVLSRVYLLYPFCYSCFYGIGYTSGMNDLWLLWRRAAWRNEGTLSIVIWHGIVMRRW